MHASEKPQLVAKDGRIDLMHFIGIEIEQNGTRTVVLDLEAGVVLAEAWAPHAWTEGLPAGYREQNPAQWIDAVDQTLRQCLNEIGPEKQRISGMGVAGPLRGLVLLDEANRIIRHAKLAGDRSVKRQAEELSRAFGGAPGLLELVGQVPGVDSAAAECLWLKQHEPYHFQRVEAMLTVQDFISYWLTGQRATEPGSASATGMFDVRTRRWSIEMMNFIDPALEAMLPPIGASQQPRGMLRGELAKEWGLSEWVQVSAGSAAPMLSALAAGCVADKTVALDWSSQGVIMGVGNAPVIDFRGEILPLCSATGSWLGLATVTNATVAPGILRRHYGWSASQFEEMVSSVAVGADGLLLLPYFTGESIPHLPEGTGMLHGISPDNFTPAHLARAAAEGVALSFGYAMSRLLDLGFEPEEIRLLGPSASSPIARQMLADVFGIPVVPVVTRQGAAVGAAMQAAVAFFQQSGESLGFDEIASYLVAGDPSATCYPNPQDQEIYQNLMSRQQYLVDTLHTAGFM